MLVVMNDTAQRPDADPGDGPDVDGSRHRLAAYQEKARTALDLLALVTLWLAVVPPWKFSPHVQGMAWTLRIALSAVYGIDLAVRGVLDRHPVRYALANPLALASVLLPPVRVVFSLRLAQSMFRRGHLVRFLLAAALLVLNGAIIVYFFERNAPDSNIRTVGEAVWWSLVTVTTVGYGDFYPVTTVGRITAGFIMLTGLLALAVVTAQVASSFVAQQPSRAQHRPRQETAPPEVTLADLDRRLARIEELLTAAGPSSRPATEAPEGRAATE